jgi:hypothetical protein
MAIRTMTRPRSTSIDLRRGVGGIFESSSIGNDRDTVLRSLRELRHGFEPIEFLGNPVKASYFCLRTEDSKWQFLGMDTGYGDRNPVEQQAPSLQVHEGAWHRDKLDTFSGTTILLSHHQLISAKEKLNGGPRPYLNENLYATFKQYFDRIAAWYWGHEHNFILFQNDLTIGKGDLPLKKGRLMGCSAYEETQNENPYAINNPAAKFMKNMPRLNLSDFKTDLQSFYNHAFAIFDVAPERITASTRSFLFRASAAAMSRRSAKGSPASIRRTRSARGSAAAEPG